MLLHLWNLENLPYFYTFLTQFLFNGGQDWVDGFAKTVGLNNLTSTYRYAVIIDAGSTGSRVHAFKFRIPYTVIAPIMLDLVEDFYAKTTPGLHEYIHDPAEGAQTIVKLIKQADFLTPLEERHRTPVLVRPTAGLRLLSKENAAIILDHVEDAIKRLGYLTDEESVKIMEGSDEGLFNWIAVNLLSRHSYARDDIKSKEMLTALDMGGSSMQIAFKVDEEHVSSYPQQDTFSVGIQNPFKVYSHSYFLGLNAARHGILQIEHELSSRRTSEMVTTDCLDPAVRNLTWTYMGQQYVLSGARYKGSKINHIFDRCNNLVKRYILKVKGFMPQTPPGSRIAAVSSFFRAAQDARIIGSNGGVVTINQYRDAAMKACSETNLTNPWLCMNLIYVTTLLDQGFKINEEDTLFLFESVKGVRVTWTVGLAYMTVVNRMTLEGKLQTRNNKRPSECLRYDRKRKARFHDIVCAYKAFRDEK